MSLNRPTWRHIFVLLYVCVLACANQNWTAQPAGPPVPVEQESPIQTLKQEATASRGNATLAIRYADAVAKHLSGGAPTTTEADPVLAVELLEAAAQYEPLRGAELDYARGNVEFAQRDYEVAVATYETNARKRGHALSATEVVRYYAAAGNRESLTAFCNDTFSLIRGGDDKNVFITECVMGMGYASPAEWSVMSGPALTEYERWRDDQAAAQQDADAEKAAAARAERDAATAAQRAETDKRNCTLRCAEKEALCKKDCYQDQCRRDCSDAEWACRRQC